MSTEDEDGGTPAVETVRVWDPVVRLFHWSLVVAFTVAYLSSEEDSALHVYAGYVVLALIVVRLIWGVVGSRHARFGDFVRPPGEVFAYLRGLASGRPRHYLGHNPAGGWMVIALLVSLFAVTLSGVMLDTAEGGALAAAGSGSVAVIATAHADDGEYGEYGERGEGDEGGEEFWEEVHEASANVTLFLVFLHIAGVIVSSLLHRENLIRAMVTGRKPRA
ncbi:cytochrome b/b6 domain-containing protein [Arhodomonas aquaeolei]|uniref:cytochrome b/b6 domain-containing protein n=1 Tax=Arhodomonas aquaeolei TaxID=2369 RepID=UPI00216A3440|nr:cytochrome b/b6 domain-containing protein [Arhodomonas aquaeolei]MCS4503554.1 cytochrome b/b6 domain-containing protein [Arhodomonas aquaeolei]